METRSSRPHAAVNEQAAHWFARLAAPDCTPREREDFVRWRDADPAHAQAWHAVERDFELSRELLEDPALAASLAQAHRPAARHWRPHAGWLAAAAVLVALVVVWPQLRETPVTEHYATGLGEQRELLMSDGSQVLLDTDTAVSVRMTRRQRQLVLERGRAQFDVAHDAERPFVVEASGGRVRALGTVFQVQADASGATVLLLEGRVAVAGPGDVGDAHVETLHPGEQLSFEDGGRRWYKRQPDLAFARGWIQGELVFNNRRLQELIEESNRYARIKLQLDDPALGDIRVSGVFRAGNHESLILALQHGWQLQARTEDDGRIVLGRPASR